MRRRDDRGQRAYDVVLFGATGFVGTLTAEYLAEHAPADTRWALAGRSEHRLKRLRDRLTTLNPALADLPVLRADVDEPATLRAVAADAHVVATTVGPYFTYGEPLVAACAEAGTDYLDLSGEPEFVDLMYLRHHSLARETGARLIHAGGFDSVPHDLGVRYTVGRLPEGVPLRVRGFVRTSARISGGTFASLLTGLSRPVGMARTAKARHRAEPAPRGRTVRAVTGAPHPLTGLGSAWAVPAPTIDPQIITRSAAALDRYGPDFSYEHYAVVKNLPMVLGGVAGVGALFTLAQVPWTREWLSGRLKPGEGPDAARRARSWFTLRFAGEGGGERVITEVSGGDPGYDETAKIFAEGALSLAFDDLPPTAGQVTSAVAMGDALTERLIRAGIRFTTVTRS
ncbi:trans-acting enoyl reductase family protein [Streptomyces sp. SAJ15]|uniref:saccharopine dehydrogenase family protein n=1 Tax=Streptomyces sp. SAJ15 TaxID=2011095 RepID=UPI001184EF10|nr:saccharopine dehydrogenase NADP-binding domain-containing protein [Streptomyces sp. SAJ15]TVL93023.1 saccharopine dehydrogenase [Streptomyces sp. SAJ15]